MSNDSHQAMNEIFDHVNAGRIEDAEVLCRTGDRLGRLGQVEDAVSAYRATLRINPLHKHARAALEAAESRRGG